MYTRRGNLRYTASFFGIRRGIPSGDQPDFEKSYSFEIPAVGIA
jgi:hypothetical protein